LLGGRGAVDGQGGTLGGTALVCRGAFRGGGARESLAFLNTDPPQTKPTPTNHPPKPRPRQLAKGADVALLPGQRHHHRGCAVPGVHLRVPRPLRLPAVGLAGVVPTGLPLALLPGKGGGRRAGPRSLGTQGLSELGLSAQYPGGKATGTRGLVWGAQLVLGASVCAYWSPLRSGPWGKWLLQSKQRRRLTDAPANETRPLRRSGPLSCWPCWVATSAPCSRHSTPGSASCASAGPGGSASACLRWGGGGCQASLTCLVS
jgi:hypothetical protein